MHDTQLLAISAVRGACPHDCPDTCAWQVIVKNGVAVKLLGDTDHPFTRGSLCAKVNHYLERVYSPDRILFPLRRVGPKGAGLFERVEWDEALNAISARLQAIIGSAGPRAILPYSNLGTQGLIQGFAMSEPFFARLGATRLERAAWGTTGTSGIEATIDPLKTRTAAAADWHIRPLPGSDAALALGMTHIIVAEGLHDADYIAQYTLGFDLLCDTPQRRRAPRSF